MQYNPLDINILKTLQNPELKIFLLLWIQEINQGSAKSSITICCMYGISIYGIFVYNPFFFFFFLWFLNSIFYDDLIPSDPRGISSSSSTCSSSASASSCLQTQWIQICSNHNQDFFFITVDSLFNMKYLPLIHCFELNRENIKLRAPNFCYDII